MGSALVSLPEPPGQRVDKVLARVPLRKQRALVAAATRRDPAASWESRDKSLAGGLVYWEARYGAELAQYCGTGSRPATEETGQQGPGNELSGPKEGSMQAPQSVVHSPRDVGDHGLDAGTEDREQGGEMNEEEEQEEEEEERGPETGPATGRGTQSRLSIRRRYTPYFDWYTSYGPPFTVYEDEEGLSSNSAATGSAAESTPVSLREVIRAEVPLRSFCLILGAGTSRLGEQMSDDGYEAVLNVDYSTKAWAIMNKSYGQKYGKWMYRVAESCSHLYIRNRPALRGATDASVYGVLKRMGAADLQTWLEVHQLGYLLPFLQRSDITTMVKLVRDADDTWLAALKALIPEGSRRRSRHHSHHTYFQQLPTLSSHNSLKSPASSVERDSRTAAALAFAGFDVSGDRSRLRHLVHGLRRRLGFFLEDSRQPVLSTGEEFMVVERRFEGGQVHLRLVSGGWVAGRCPLTGDATCHRVRKIRGGFPQPSSLPHPDPESNSTQVSNLPRLEYRLMNAMDLKCQDKTVDAVVAKATIDAVLCRGVQGLVDAKQILAQIYRVLRPSGVCVVISHVAPNKECGISRIKLFTASTPHYRWSVQIRRIPKPMNGDFFFAYILRPQPLHFVAESGEEE